MTNHGDFNWNELQTDQPDAVIQFYRETVGWEFRAEKMPSGGTYWIGVTAGKPVCGVLDLNSTNEYSKTNRWVTYVHINDLESAINQIARLGGKLIKAPWVVPGVGRVAWVQDPCGAEIGWVTPVAKYNND